MSGGETIGSLLDEHIGHHYCIILGFVSRGVDKRYHRMAPELGDEIGPGRIAGKFLAISRFKILPSGSRIVVEPMAQCVAWGDGFVPQIVMECLVRQTSGPQPVDIYPQAV